MRRCSIPTGAVRVRAAAPNQFNLPLEDAEVAQGVLEAAQEKAEAALQGPGAAVPRKPRRNRGHLPPQLPRIERVIAPASTHCPCGRGEIPRDCGTGPRFCMIHCGVVQAVPRC
jgi:transposase